MTNTLHPSDLKQFTGSQDFFRHSINRAVIYTEGAHYLAEHGSAYWLLDAIAIAQAHIPAVRRESFQSWRLAVNDDLSALLTCDDGNGNTVYTQPIPFTDFPLREVRLYCCDNTILLPSEY